MMIRIVLTAAVIAAAASLGGCAVWKDFGTALACSSAERTPSLQSPPAATCERLRRQGLY